MDRELSTEEMKRRLAAARERRGDYIRVSKGADDLATRLKVGRWVAKGDELIDKLKNGYPESNVES